MQGILVAARKREMIKTLPWPIRNAQSKAETIVNCGTKLKNNSAIDFTERRWLLCCRHLRNIIKIHLK